MFKFLFWLFGHDKKANVKFKIYDVTNCKTNNYKIYIARYLKNLR